MKCFYPQTKSDLDFAKSEKEILEFWNTENTFDKSVQKNTKNKFVFYDGPPFANGMPHYGHLLTGFAKDAIARFWTMLGYRVERKFGWDCHGLPAEMYAEKELGIGGAAQIKKFGIKNFNQTCKDSVMKFASQWQEYVRRQGRWVDFDGGYKTMDTSFMESVIWAFKELYKKGLIYQSVKVVPYSWACQTPLSNFETRMDNAYRQKASKAVTVAFRLLSDLFGDGIPCYVLAWTTTPWTLPSNLMLAVNTKIKYRRFKKDGKNYIAADFATDLFKDCDDCGCIDPEKLLNVRYQPLFPYFSNKKNAFFIVNADFVEEGEGTGIVHIAPGFGEDDFEIAKKHDVDVICSVDESGKFTEEIKDFAGQHVFDTNDDVIKFLKQNGSWINTTQYLHNYPHCWRTDTPLIYKAVPSWYVKVTAIKKDMIKMNKQINWVPNHVKEGLFGNWLEGARDWAISRNRFWGTPVPVWQSTDPNYPRVDVYGSIAELEKDFGVKIKDLHRPFIDDLRRKNPDDPTGKSEMVRVFDVLDCWFESGSMPFAQCHYPFENKSWFESSLPADFITEYVAQTRGWFYTLTVLSTALFLKPPFKNCICHGVILDSEGQKLSKRLNNYADPIHVFDNYGSDALRFLMLSSGVMTGGNLLIDKECNMVKDALRLVLKPIWSAYNFFTTYANFHHIKANKVKNFSNKMDVYISSKCNLFIRDIEKHLKSYDTASACRAAVDFVDVLNNWYIRRTRDKFVEGKKEAFDALYTVLLNLVCAVAPLLPFLSEKIWLGMTENLDSVHLQNFPADDANIDLKLVSYMDKARDICGAALFLRNQQNIRIRQPLKLLTINTECSEELLPFLDFIKDEVNVKTVKIDKESLRVKSTVKLNFKVVGKRYPNKVKMLSQAIIDSRWQRKKDGFYIDGMLMQDDEYEVVLGSDDKNVYALADGKTVIALDAKIDKGLKMEGIARDMIRFIQQMRKDAGLNIKDRATIKVAIDAKNDDYAEAVKHWEGEVLKLTYCDKMLFDDDCLDCVISKQLKKGVVFGVCKSKS